MTDLVARLERGVFDAETGTYVSYGLCDEAADTIATLRAEIERLRAGNRDLQLWFDDLKIEYDKLRAALAQINHGWENPMDDKAYRALCRFMWETARAALAAWPGAEVHNFDGWTHAEGLVLPLTQQGARDGE